MFVVVVYIMQVWCRKCDQMADVWPTWPPWLWSDHRCSAAPCPRPAAMVVTNKTYCPVLHQILGWGWPLFKGFMGDLQPRIIPWSTTPSSPLLSAFINIDIVSYLWKFKFPPSDCFSTKLSLLNPSTVSKQQKALVLTVPMEAPGSWLVTPPGWCNL